MIFGSLFVLQAWSPIILLEDPSINPLIAILNDSKACHSHQCARHSLDHSCGTYASTACFLILGQHLQPPITVICKLFFCQSSFYLTSSFVESTYNHGIDQRSHVAVQLKHILRIISSVCFILIYDQIQYFIRCKPTFKVVLYEFIIHLYVKLLDLLCFNVL